MPTNIVATAYCICHLCTKGTGLAANNLPPREGITVAASRAIPLGTKIALTVPGAFTNRVFVVEDRLARRFDSRVDVFFADHKRARQFGIHRDASFTILRNQTKQ